MAEVSDILEVSPNLQEIIDNLPPQIPEDFKRQAKIAAQYILNLDGNKTPTKEEVKFKDQLANSGFVEDVYVNYELGKSRGSPRPEHALPPWLLKNGKEGHVAKPVKELIEKSVERWIHNPVFTKSKGEWGTYYILDGEDEKNPQPRQFKLYIEEDELVKGVNSGDLQEVIHKLKLEGIDPFEMKFNESSLVLYFRRDVANIEQIKERFQTYNIEFRGPAQDVFQVNTNPDGSLQLDIRTSNDDALTSASVKYDLQKYSPSQFLDKYLQFCLSAGKDPSEPYKTSFVWFIDEKKMYEGNEQAKKTAEELAGYPVVYAQSRFDFLKI